MEERLREMRKGRRERIEKGSHCFFKSSGYDKLELKHKNLNALAGIPVNKKVYETVRLFAEIKQLLEKWFPLQGERGHSSYYPACAVRAG